MLESIISPGIAEKNPWDLVILGFLLASAALFVGQFLSGFIDAEPSMLILAITVMALAPLLHRILVIEEEEDESEKSISPVRFMSSHMDAISAYSFLFLGLAMAFSFWFVVLPYGEGFVDSSELFGLQESVIGNLQSQISGKAAAGMAAQRGSLDPSVARPTAFERLYQNNLKVMLFCFLASFLFGAGALWLLAWNASVIGVFIGSAIKTKLVGMSAIEAYAIGFPIYSLSIALWAIPELLAYFAAALAGGIISVAVSKHHFKSESFWLAVFDSIIFMLLAVFLVFLGAYIEQFFVAV